MKIQPQQFTFSPTARVTFAGNVFINTPIILQFDDVPLVEVVKTAELERTTKIQIYNSDGVHLATAKGTRLFPTKHGRKAGLSLRCLPNVNVAEVDGKTLFEVRRDGPAAVALTAELYSPEGSFIKAGEYAFGVNSREGIAFGGVSAIGCTIEGFRIGFLATRDGRFVMGVR